MNATLKKIQNGHKEELELFIYDAYPKIYSFIFRKLGNDAMAKDLTQETFLKFVRYVETLPSDTKLLSYLYRIAHNLCNDYYRSSHREVEEVDIVSGEKPLLEHMIEIETKNHIQNAIQGLSEDQKDVVILKYYQNLKIKEIALILNEKESTIKTRLRLATRKLKKILEGGEIDET